MMFLEVKLQASDHLLGQTQESLILGGQLGDGIGHPGVSTVLQQHLALLVQIVQLLLPVKYGLELELKLFQNLPLVLQRGLELVVALD